MITVVELDALMPTIFLSNQLNSVDWSNISVTDKEVLIGQSVAYMNTLRYEGVEKEKGQVNAFPRIIRDTVVEVAEEVKRALCCIVYDYLHNLGSRRYELRKQGVTSISTGGVSESYSDEVVEEVSDRYKQYIGEYLFKGIL